jgi:flavin-dependent dehydrogenase
VVGDACETFDPCAGFGMAHALISGRLAALCLLRGLEGASPLDAAHDYAARREDGIRDVRGFARLTSATMTSGVGRMSLPFIVSTGLAARFSDCVHSAHTEGAVRGLVSLLGVRAREEAQRERAEI